VIQLSFRAPALRLVASALGLALVTGACSAAATIEPAPSATPEVTGPPGLDICPTSQPAALAPNETREVTIETALGSIVVTVDGSLSPIAGGNFVALAACGYYDGVVFHRVVTQPVPFVIQGGDPSGTGSGGPGYTIADEPVTTAYSRGTVAMARTPAPNSQGSQFFIVLDDAARPALESANTYAIFGTVTAGMETVDAIAAASGGVELPADPVVMTRVTVADR
jgi:cyclophilin family peptidyl-prolyl cis-trans isomerase